MVQVVLGLANIVFPVVVGLESCAALILHGVADVVGGLAWDLWTVNDGVDDLDCFHRHFVVVGLFFFAVFWVFWVWVWSFDYLLFLIC